MSRTIAISRSLYRRPLTRLAVALLTLLLLGARCIEHDTLYRDESGNLHIVGEIYNDTDVQGAQMVLGGTLYDGAGNVLATAQSPTCPYELSPHTRSTFDIEFRDSSGVPMPARYEVRAVSGKALTAALGPLHATLSNLKATRSGIGVEITGSIRAGQSYDGFYSGCAAFYSADEDVLRQLTIIGFGELPADVDQPIDVILPGMPAEAKTMRLWIVGPGDSPLQSNYLALMSDSVTIR